MKSAKTDTKKQESGLEDKNNSAESEWERFKNLTQRLVNTPKRKGSA